MFKFSERSWDRLETCDERLQQVATRAMAKQAIDFGIAFGWRGEDEQNRLVSEGKSKLRWPNSKHNHLDVLGKPSALAFDAYPYIRDGSGRGFIPQTDTRYWYFLAGVIISSAEEVGVKLRWGGDWDTDQFYGDQTFDDLGHFELGE